MKWWYLVVLFSVGVFLEYDNIHAQSTSTSGSANSANLGNLGDEFVGAETFHISSLDHQINTLRGSYIRTYTTIESSYEKVKGSPYMFKRFVNATITLNNDSQIEDAKVNYDGYVGSIIAQDNEDDLIMLDARYIKRVVVDDSENYAIFEKANPDHPDKFFQVLYNKNGLVFYKDPGIKMYEKKTNGIFETPARFAKQYRYYILNEDNETIAVNLKKKEVFQHFPQIELIAMEEIIKKKNYKMKKESDFVALFAQL